MGGLGEVVLSPVETNGCEREGMPLGRRLRRGHGAGPADGPLLNPTLHCGCIYTVCHPRAAASEGRSRVCLAWVRLS